MLRVFSAVEQVANHLRSEIASGHFSGTMPGVNQLAESLGVSPKTVVASLKQLENEGLLVGQGPRRNRLIVPPDGIATRPLRIAILLYEPADQEAPYIIDLRHALMTAGNTVFHPAKSLTETGMDPASVERLVNQTEADAWVVLAGAREVLEWFSSQPIPAFAIFGRRTGLPIASAGPASLAAVISFTRQLVALGHRRIVKICRSERRKPGPGRTERAFLKELETLAIPTGSYNLPDWEESPEGFQAMLHSLFRVSPPTALILDEAPFLVAAQQFLGARGLRVPEHVSLVCCVSDPIFDWCTPSVAHIQWDKGPLIQRVTKWAANVHRGKRDVRQTQFPASAIIGGTIGPAPQ